MALKLLFDECVGEPVMQGLAAFLDTSEDKPQLAHVRQFQMQGMKDVEWIPKIAADGWIIMTADSGKRPKDDAPEEKLPYLCRKHRITHVILSATVHARKSFEKAQAIIQVWEDLLKLPGVTRGTRFRLRLNNSGRAILMNADARPTGRKKARDNGG